MLSALLPLVFHLGLVSVRAQVYSATYLPSNAPVQSEQGQSGTNQCGTGSNQTSQCQNAYRELSPLSSWEQFVENSDGHLSKRG